MFMAASIVGPLLGGILTDYVHWTLIFWIDLPLGLSRLRSHRPLPAAVAAQRPAASARSARAAR